jgi:hypothetical protein
VADIVIFLDAVINPHPLDAPWVAIAHYDRNEGWQQTFRDPAVLRLNTLQSLERGKDYWIFRAAEVPP